MKKTRTKIKADAKFCEKANAKFCENVFLRRLRLSANFFTVFLLVVIAALGLACESPSLKKVDSSGAPQANASETAAVKSGLEDDLQTMRNANFDYIYVFRRKDGGALDGEDKKYLKTYSPPATNRFILTEENKAVIAGSSFKFEQENLDNLQKRFVVENFSKPETQESETENRNAPKNAKKRENSNR